MLALGARCPGRIGDRLPMAILGRSRKVSADAELWLRCVRSSFGMSDRNCDARLLGLSGFYVQALYLLSKGDIHTTVPGSKTWDLSGMIGARTAGRTAGESAGLSAGHPSIPAARGPQEKPKGPFLSL